MKFTCRANKMGYSQRMRIAQIVTANYRVTADAKAVWGIELGRNPVADPELSTKSLVQYASNRNLRSKKKIGARSNCL